MHVLTFCSIFTFLIPILVATVQVCVHGTTKSPVETHGVNVYAFLLATIIFIFYSAFTTADTQFSSIIAFITGFFLRFLWCPLSSLARLHIPFLFYGLWCHLFWFIFVPL
ncbi:hypothetical protein Patl1_32752 [Pistacia atlantica]|uniref:Uncharacterized protein n=1 Tax=Pistacia atlantica TaxID=434234 RepID=A0ACC1ANY2_9ROSI|nr:hypothetical protein Patl1_32752 [Pistacia atlantica]